MDGSLRGGNNGTVRGSLAGITIFRFNKMGTLVLSTECIDRWLSSKVIRSE